MKIIRKLKGLQLGLAALALSLVAGPVWAGSITFSGSAAFLDAPSANGAGSVTYTGSPANLTDGFQYPGSGQTATVTYNATSADDGKSVTLTWEISRSFSYTAGSYTTTTNLSMHLQSGSFASGLYSQLQSVTLATEWGSDSSTQSSVTPSESTSGSTAFYIGGPVSSSVFTESGSGSTTLIQTFTAVFTPTAAFQTFEFVVPDTAISESDTQSVNQDTSSAPEPATLTMLCIGLAAMGGYGWRKRKHAGADEKPS